MRLFVFLLLLFSTQLFSTLLSAKSQYGDVQINSIASIYDADTFRVNIDNWPAVVGQSVPVRVRGIDAPEIRGKCAFEKDLAQQARLLTVSLLNSAEVVELRNIERGKYFRLLADVYIDGENLAEQLIAQQLSRPYDGGKRLTWCQAITLIAE